MKIMVKGLNVVNNHDYWDGGDVNNILAAVLIHDSTLHTLKNENLRRAL